MKITDPDDDEDDDQPASGLALQSRGRRFSPEGAHDSEFTTTLALLDDSEAAQRLERLADADIISTLQLQQFDPNTSDWGEFAFALAEYGYSVFKGWFISGSVYRMAANHGGGRGVFGLNKIPEDLQLSNDDNGGGAHELAAELVLVAIDAYRRKTLMNPDPEKRWTATGGASIKTFFVGRCLMELPDIYERMARKERRIQNEGHRFWKMSDGDGRHGVDPAGPVSDSAALDGVFKDAEPIVRVMFELQQEGYKYDEIADMLSGAGIDMTPAQVRTKMSRLRTVARGPQR